MTDQRYSDNPWRSGGDIRRVDRLRSRDVRRTVRLRSHPSSRHRLYGFTSVLSVLSEVLEDLGIDDIDNAVHSRRG